ncbi:tetratricopeptide repeat protein [bacterium]|nr:MAG: tetratricopeptide repeat protein [bacterium]
MFKRSLILCVVLLSFIGQIKAQQVLLQEANQIKEKDYEKALALYSQVIDADPNNFEATWNLAFLYTKVGNRAAKKEDKETYFKKAMELSEKSLQLDPNSTYSHYVYAVALGRMGDIMGAKQRVQNATLIKEHTEKALEIDPSHAAAWHLLGKLNYRLHNLNMAEKAAAAVLFGGLPSGVSTEKAAEYYQKAVDLRGDYLLYRLDLSVALIKLGKKAEAKKVLEKAITLPAITEDDPQNIEDCKNLLKRLG